MSALGGSLTKWTLWSILIQGISTSFARTPLATVNGKEWWKNLLKKHLTLIKITIVSNFCEKILEIKWKFRSLCECDAQLARDIYEQRQTYDRDFHHRYGTFNKDQCRSVNRGKYEEVSGNKKDKGTGAGKGLGPQCCGEFPKRFSYKPGKQECCANNQIASIGSC